MNTKNRLFGRKTDFWGSISCSHSSAVGQDSYLKNKDRLKNYKKNFGYNAVSYLNLSKFHFWLYNWENFSALQEAQDIFGVDVDFDDFIEEEEEDDDADDYDEDDEKTK